MKIYTILVASVSVLATLSAAATDINKVTAGSLAGLVGADTLSTSLNIAGGELNAADFSFIADKMSDLAELDISGCRIVAYKGDPLPYSRLTSSKAASIPSYAFVGMKKLRKVSLPASLRSIGSGAFSGCSLTEMTIPEGVTEIGDYAFLRCESLVSVTIPASLTVLGKGVFSCCSALAAVNFNGSGVTSLPESTFEGCVSMTRIDFSSLAACTEIGPWSLAHMSGLTAITLPDNTRRMNRGAMIADTQIADMQLPADIEYIDSHVMSGLMALNSINAEKLQHVPELGDDVWSGVHKPDVYLVTADKTMQEAFQNALQWQEFNIKTKDEWTGTTDMIGDEIGQPHFTVYTEGSELIVDSSGSDIGEVSVFDTAGIRTASLCFELHKARVRIETSSWAKGIYLVVTNLGVTKIAL